MKSILISMGLILLACTKTDAQCTITISAQYSTTVCQGVGNLLTAVASNGTSTSFQWEWTLSGNVWIPISHPTTDTLTATHEGDYRVIGSFSCGSNIYSNTIHVGITPTPVTPSITASTPVCAGDTIYLTASTAS